MQKVKDEGPRGCYRPSKNDWIQNERGKKVTKAGKQNKKKMTKKEVERKASQFE